MALKYIAGTLSSFGVYAIVPGLLQRLPSGSWELSAQTVHSVELVHVGKEYNYAKGGVGMFAGAAFAGPVGMLVGGLLPKAFKDDVVQFVIRFRNGDVAHFAGSHGDYKRALNSSYKGGHSTSLTAEEAGSDASERDAEQSELERLRAEVAALRAAEEPPPAPAPEAPTAQTPTDTAAPPEQTPSDVETPAPALPPKDPEEIAAEHEASVVEAMEARGHSRIWFSDIARRKFAPPPEDDSVEAAKRQADQNAAYLKEHKAELRKARKAHEAAIVKAKLPLKEHFRAYNEIGQEYTFRTKKK